MKILYVVVFCALSLTVQASQSSLVVPLGIFGAEAQKTVTGKPWVGAWTANASFGTPLQQSTPMLVDLGSVTIVVPNRLLQTPDECPEKTLGNLAASNYSLTSSTTGRLVPFGTATCFENPASYTEPVKGALSCFMDIAYGGGEFVGPMVTDTMSIGGEDFTVNFGMPTQSFDCSLAATQILGMNQGKSSFLSQAYARGGIDEKVVGFCGSREAPFMVLGSDASIPDAALSAASFPLYDGGQLVDLPEYTDDEDLMKTVEDINNSTVRREHYYTVIDSVVVGAEPFSSPQVAMIDSGWTDLGLTGPMVDSLTSYVNQSLVENGMDEDISLILNPDQNYPKGCVRYNSSQYPNGIALANMIYPTIDITLQGGSSLSINLTETTAFYGDDGEEQLMCANVASLSDGPVMLGTPFFMDRFVELNPDKNTGSFTDLVECQQVKDMIPLDHEAPSSSSSRTADLASCMLVFVLSVLCLI
ncbi:hypothetical protein M9435_005734 [Picochlorum sp. BPE23]|nr:hypothetical protein M9435_005734 [Picochlorum sp. BPE23]